MFLLWISVLAISMSWLFSLHLYTPPNSFGTFLLLGISILSAGMAFQRSKGELDRKISYLAPLLLVPSGFLPYPYNIGPIFIFVGLLIIPMSRRWISFSSLPLTLLFIGTLLILQSLLPHLYFLFTSQSHYFHPITPLLYRLLKFMKVPVSFSQDTVFIRTFRELYAFPTTWEKLALLPFLNLLVGGIFLFLLFSKRGVLKWRITFFLLLGLGYLVLRYLLLILLFLYTMFFVDYDAEIIRMDLFWNPTFTLLSFLPFLFFVWKFFPLEVRTPIRIFLPFRNRKTFLSCLSFSLGTIFLVSSFGFHDPGKKKGGRVLIDEKHSEWEKTTRPYDTEWYGAESGYNYASIADYLKYYYKVDRNFEEITREGLSHIDILVVKIPSHPFSQKEIEAILQFVENGGGLYLLGDHTNVFGSGHYLNEIARHFGFLFRYDCLFDFQKTFEQVYTPPPILPHPIVNRMPPFLFATSCSIEPLSLRNERVILSSGLKALDIDYSSGNFYPQVRDITEMTFGSFIQTIAVKYGKGRVVGFTDSTVFSNFSAFIAGKPELFLGTIDWLNRKNHLHWLNRLFFILSLFSFGLALLQMKKGKIASPPSPKSATVDRNDRSGSNLGFIILLLVLGVFAWTMTLHGMTRFTRINYPLPMPHTQPVRIAFEKDHSQYELPITGFVKEQDRSFSIFYQWVLRLGYFPFVGRSLEEGMEEGELVILINPQKGFTHEEVEKLKIYIAQGGKVLLMDSPSNDQSTANQLLKNFGMEIHREDRISLFQGNTDLIANPVEGGEILIMSEEGKGIFSMVRVGKGILAVLSFSDRFVDSQMGNDEGVIPDEYLLRVFQLEFSILRGLIENTIESDLLKWKDASKN